MANNKYIDLHRAIISVSGADAYKFLQGIITNDLGKITDSNIIYTYLLTPQGKYLFDFFVSKSGDSFLIDAAISDKDDLLKKLKMYKLRSQVEINDLNDKAVYAVTDKSEGNDDPRSDKMPSRLISDIKQGAASEEEYNKIRIENNIPEGNDLEKDKSFPFHFRMQELNGVDFKKGCYVGQEVVTRTYRRGEIRKTTYNVQAESALNKGADVAANGAVVGRIIGVSGNKAIALLEKDVVEKALPLTTLGFALKIV